MSNFFLNEMNRIFHDFSSGSYNSHEEKMCIDLSTISTRFLKSNKFVFYDSELYILLSV
jgi:hypothetical protein